MNRTITVSNRQLTTKPISVSGLKAIVKLLLEDELRLDQYELGIFLVSDEEITKLNERFLRHAGGTDVITFDYSSCNASDEILGEIFVCAAEAERQAARFGVSWEKELARYVIHGVLHLCGYDDDAPVSRRQMKRVEDRLVRAMEDRSGFRTISRKACSGSRNRQSSVRT